MARTFYGTYTGNDAVPLNNTRRTIVTGAGFTVALVVISPAPANTQGTTNTFSFGVRGNANSWDLTTFGLQSTANSRALVSGTDNIEVGYNCNANLQTYYYALLENDPAVVVIGSYTGNATARTITTTSTWQPKHVMTMATNTNLGAQWFNEKGGDNTLRMDTTGNWLAGLITGVGFDGTNGTFSLGTSFVVNQNLTPYNYVIFTDDAAHGYLRSMYTGNGSDNRVITVGSEVDFLHILFRTSGAIVAGFWGRMKPVTGDSSLRMGTAVGAGWQANGIQQIMPDISSDFQVGTANGVNKTGDATDDYPWWGFGPGLVVNLATPSPLPAQFAGSTTPMLPFSPYARYKSVRQAVQIYNDLSLAP